MPFTLAHAAVLVPCRRLPSRWLSLTGLAFGAMAPDLEYFVRLSATAGVGHTPAGVLLFDLPAALLLAWLFHGLVRRPLLRHLPAPLDRLLAPAAEAAWRTSSWRALVLLAGSAVLGSLSHLAWDASTHPGGAVVVVWPLLSSPLPLLPWRIPVYKLLQHGSTLLGLTVLARWIYTQWVVRGGEAAAGSVSAGGKARYWAIVFLGAAALAGYRIATTGGLDLRQYGAYIVSLLSGSLLGVVVASALFRNE